MTTSVPSPLQLDLLTSSAEASPAKTFRSPAKERDSLVSDLDYGESSPVSFARFDPDSSSWRTSQLCFIEGQASFSATWPRSGTMQNGIAYRLRPLVPLTGATAYGLWPTPVTADSGDGRGAPKSYKRGNLSLSGAVMLPTPRAEGMDAMGAGRRAADSLLIQARTWIWPTPTVKGNHNKHGQSKKAGDGLATAVRRWDQLYPTPTAAPYGSNKGGAAGRMGKDRPSLATMASRDLWPTPMARERSAGLDGGSNSRRAAQARGMWPTPKASPSGPDFARANRPDSGSDDLATAVAREQREHFPSPAARDWRSGKGRSENGHTPQLPETVGGQLNPTFVEWLMGFPLGFSASRRLATPSSR